MLFIESSMSGLPCFVFCFLNRLVSVRIFLFCYSREAVLLPGVGVRSNHEGAIDRWCSRVFGGCCCVFPNGLPPHGGVSPLTFWWNQHSRLQFVVGFRFEPLFFVALLCTLTTVVHIGLVGFSNLLPVTGGVEDNVGSDASRTFDVMERASGGPSEGGYLFLERLLEIAVERVSVVT